MTYRIRVQKFRQRHDGQPVEMYLAALPAEEVIARKKIEEQTASKPDGYQRRLEQGRVKSISRYVLRGEGMLPTSLLLNIRQGARFEQEDDGTFGWLIIDDEQQLLRVLDGQHRAGCVELAIEQRNGRIATAKRSIPEPLE